MIMRSWLLISCLLLSSLSAIAQTEVVKECKQKAFPKDVPAGNYSGIVHFKDNEYAVVSDKSDTDGFFIFEIDIDTLSGDIKSIGNKGFYGDSTKNADCEGITYNPYTHTFFISRESDNEIPEYTPDGKATGRRLDVPDVYKNIVGNYGFESLTYDADRHLFWTVNESTLKCDGENATSTNGVRNILRLQSFNDSLKPVKQYAYLMDAPEASSHSSNYAMGASEVLALENGHLLILEREFFVPQIKLGAFVQCKLYEVVPDECTPITESDIAADERLPVPKRLVYSFKTKLGLFDRSIANYEGMCLGPTLSDGNRVLILVSDSQNQYAGVLKDWFKTIVIKR